MSHLLYRRRTACFRCGTIAAQPCPGHECCGVLAVWQLRPWVPYWLISLIGPLIGSPR